MSVIIEKTAGTRAEISWDPKDDPRGFLARAVETDQLACALESLGRAEPEPDMSAEAALLAAAHTHGLAQLLERRATVAVVQMRDHHGLSWRQIAGALYDNPEKQSSVRRMYDSGRRHLGL